MLTWSKPKTVQINCFRQWCMRAAKVQHQRPIDEYPAIIIPAEFKFLPTLVHESVVHLHCEKIIVAINLIFEAFPVDWEESGRIHDQGARCCARHVKFDGHWNINARYVVVPFVKMFRGGKGMASPEHWLPIPPKFLMHQPFCRRPYAILFWSLEVRVRAFKITNGCMKCFASTNLTLLR